MCLMLLSLVSLGLNNCFDRLIRQCSVLTVKQVRLLLKNSPCLCLFGALIGPSNEAGASPRRHHLTLTNIRLTDGTQV